MKKLLTFIAIAMISTGTKAQELYTISPDPKHPEVRIFNGIITKDDLLKAPDMAWFQNNQKGYTPSAETLKTFADNKDSLKFIVFGGTWCDDTHSIMPKFFSLLSQAGVADTAVTMFGTDRDKKVIGHIGDALNITRVPTFIVMKNGKELGRVEEWGMTGKWDDELAEIIRKKP